MSNFQTNTLLWAIFIAVFRGVFCISILGIDVYVWVLWALSSICMGLWIWWNQKWMWFVGWVLSIFTALWFLFSIIPVYDHNISLSSFYAWEIPSIVCDQSIKGTILIDTISVTMNDICKRKWFPILSEQVIDIQTQKPVLINLAMWDSVVVPPTYKWVIKRSIKQWVPRYNFDSTIPDSTIQQATNQNTIKQSFIQKKREYLQKNYLRKREYAPSITKIAIRKMRLLSLIDRSYSDKVRNLEVYMKEVNTNFVF